MQKQQKQQKRWLHVSGVTQRAARGRRMKQGHDGVGRGSPSGGIGDGHEATPLEQIYQRKTPVEHVLLRPDSYVGSTQRTTQELWVLERTPGGHVAHHHHQPKVLPRECRYVPALYKVFDEILVNAADNKQRLRWPPLLQHQLCCSHGIGRACVCGVIEIPR